MGRVGAEVEGEARRSKRGEGGLERGVEFVFVIEECGSNCTK